MLPSRLAPTRRKGGKMKHCLNQWEGGGISAPIFTRRNYIQKQVFVKALRRINFQCIMDGIF